MDAREKAVKNAVDQVVDQYTKDATAYNQFYGFNDTVIVLKGIGKDIDADLEAISTKQQKFTHEKNLSKGSMVEIICRAAGMVLAYAGLNRTYAVPTAVQVTPYSLKRRREADLPADCKAVLNVCVALGNDLTPHGFTDEVLKAARQAIDDFTKKKVESPEFVSWKKAANKRISANLIKAEDILDNTLDPIARLFSDSEPLLYAQYLSLRKIKAVGTHALSMKGKIMDSVSKLLLQRVKATILRTAFPDGTKAIGPDAVSFIKFSTKKGTLQLKSMPAGTYTITLVKAGYAVQTITIYVNDNELTKFEVNLVKL